MLTGFFCSGYGVSSIPSLRITLPDFGEFVSCICPPLTRPDSEVAIEFLFTSATGFMLIFSFSF